MHPDATYISNWVARAPNVPQLAVLNRIAAWLPGLQRQVWFGGGADAYVYGSRRPAWQRAFPMPVEGGPLYERASGGGDLKSSFGEMCRFGGGALVVAKRIANNRRIQNLAEEFPDAHFVEVVRDGRAVAYSLSRVDWWADSPLWWHDGSPRQCEERGEDPWELCARAWVRELEVVEAGVSGLRPERVATIAYERLVEEPMAVLGELADFAGFESSDGWTRRLGRLTFPNRNEAWRRRLSADQVAIIEGVQSEALRRRGYDV